MKRHSISIQYVMFRQVHASPYVRTYAVWIFVALFFVCQLIVIFCSLQPKYFWNCIKPKHLLQRLMIDAMRSKSLTLQLNGMDENHSLGIIRMHSCTVLTYNIGTVLHTTITYDYQGQVSKL